MKKITSYKLTNGQIVEDRKEAIKAQRTIDFESAVWLFANKYGEDIDGVDKLGQIILDNAVELRSILNIIT